MKRVYKFKQKHALPIVSAVLYGRYKSKVVRLIFDTGAATTQIHTPIIDSIDYSALDALGLIESYGPAGPMQQGFSVKIEKVNVLGKEFNLPLISVYDFDNFSKSGLHGLLGFDLIRQMDLELRGSKGELIVF